MRCGSPSTHSPGAGCSLVSRATPECGWEEARSHQWQGHGGAAFSTHTHAHARTHAFTHTPQGSTCHSLGRTGCRKQRVKSR